MVEKCAECGLEFDPRELPSVTNKEDKHRAHTGRGLMHFSCYWKVREAAALKSLNTKENK